MKKQRIINDALSLDLNNYEHSLKNLLAVRLQIAKETKKIVYDSPAGEVLYSQITQINNEIIRMLTLQ